MSRIIGTNKRCYPDENGKDGRMNTHVAVVLVEGSREDYSAYVGIGSPEWIAQFGDKISFEEACIHFPGGQLKKELYRE